MNLYDNIFNVFWEHLANFETNIMSMKYPKRILNNVTKLCFFLQKNHLKRCEVIWKW
jgi:hypothetical protein